MKQVAVLALGGAIGGLWLMGSRLHHPRPAQAPPHVTRSRPWRPFLGRWGAGGIIAADEYRRDGVLVVHTCTGADVGRWDEIDPRTLRLYGSGWGPTYVRWRISADGNTLLTRVSFDGHAWYPEEAAERYPPRKGAKGYLDYRLNALIRAQHHSTRTPHSAP